MKKNNIKFLGKILKVFSGAICTIEINVDEEVKHTIKAYLSGKMIKNHIKVTEGDIVSVIMTSYDTNKARIYKRYDK